MKVLDHGDLTLDAALADDLAVVNAARVSFNQHDTGLDMSGRKLIGFLMRNRHGTPFEHGFFRFIVKCPIFVAREWHRHRVGHSYNEWSGRYSKIEPEFYVPEEIRVQVGKPGAYMYETAHRLVSVPALQGIKDAFEQSYVQYERMLEAGVAKEQARIVLPVATYTKFYWTCNPRSLMHFLSLRADEQAMWEIRQYALKAESVFAEKMPVTYQAFIEGGRVAP